MLARTRTVAVIKRFMARYLHPVFGRRTILFSLILIFSSFDTVRTQDRPSYLPNPKLTPGATLSVTRDDVCESGNRNLAHHIPITAKRQVFDRYGIKPDAPGAYDVDRLIPTTLGGSNAIKNLWPQSLSGEWNHEKKNRLEHRLRKMVCSGALDLKDAQQEIAKDWVSAYKKYLGQSRHKRSTRHGLSGTKMKMADHDL